MFGQKQDKAAPVSTAPTEPKYEPTSTPSSGNFVSKDVSISGKLKLSGDITIDGKLDGEISSKGIVTVSNNADIKANIFAKAIIVSGKVVGNLSATDRLEINQTAHVIGDAKAAVLKVEPGASFSGSCQVGASVKITEPTTTSSSKAVPVKPKEQQTLAPPAKA